LINYSGVVIIRPWYYACQNVLIEWLDYTPQPGSPGPGGVLSNLVENLVSLLQINKREIPGTLNCLGYFDDRPETDDKDIENMARFGLVYEMPVNEENALVVSLF
jgi:hypothetical protein